MAYGAYMPKEHSLGKTVVIIGILDTLVAVVAGLVIFSIVFANGLDPAAGPSLMFKTLPVAFSQMPGGIVLGGMFLSLLPLPHGHLLSLLLSLRWRGWLKRQGFHG